MFVWNKHLVFGFCWKVKNDIDGSPQGFEKSLLEFKLSHFFHDFNRNICLCWESWVAFVGFLERFFLLILDTTEKKYGDKKHELTKSKSC